MFKRKKYLALLLTLVMSTITVSGCANFGSDPDAETINQLFDATKENLYYATSLSVSGLGQCNIDCNYTSTTDTSSTYEGIDAYTATENINISFTRQYAGTKDYRNTLVINDAYEQKDNSITSIYLGHTTYDKSEHYGYTLVQEVKNGEKSSAGSYADSWEPLPDVDIMELLFPDLDKCSLYIDESEGSTDTVVLSQNPEYGFEYYKPFLKAFSQKINYDNIDNVKYTFDANTHILKYLYITGHYRESKKGFTSFTYNSTCYYNIVITVDSYEF